MLWLFTSRITHIHTVVDNWWLCKDLSWNISSSMTFRLPPTRLVATARSG
jgi:hypothetical protein